MGFALGVCASHGGVCAWGVRLSWWYAVMVIERFPPSCLLRTRTGARSQDVYTQHKVGSRTETEQPFMLKELFQPRTPLKGADIGAHALQGARRALPSSARGSRVEFSEPEFQTILKHSLVHGDGNQESLQFISHVRIEKSEVPLAAQWVGRPSTVYVHR